MDLDTILVFYFRYNSDSKLYFGQRVSVLPLYEYECLKSVVNHTSKGYSFDMYIQLEVPDIKTTLRLKINGVVKNIIIGNNSEIMYIYTVFASGMDDGQVECLSVSNDMKVLAFEDFYKKRCRTI
uniref:Uncharacterized protein n=1 Tax=Strongyloides papillosus TaxID=174720 RepID=A0A0N5BMT9_STREA